jgi:uncharacterized protein YggE
MAEAPILSWEGLGLQQGGRWLFRDLDLHIGPRDRLALIGRTGEILDALVAAGATDLSGPDWSIEDDSAALAQARREAMEQARTQSLEYARAAGYADIRLLEISESIQQNSPIIVTGRSLRAEAQDASTPVQPGMVQASVTVRVSYEMTR